MINFFRRIRYDLMGGNPPERGNQASKTGKPAYRTGRYLKYAIGEIILVMIGILMALQVNNWNEERKLNLAWKTYTKSLIEDLQQDTITLNNVIKFIENDSIYLEKLFVRLSSPNTTIDSLKKVARYELYYNSKTFRPPNNKTFLAMQSNGTIELFDRDTYNLLLKLQTSQSIAEQIITANNSLYRQELANYISKYSSSQIKTIEGPLMNRLWDNLDSDELIRTVQGFMASKKGMNINTGRRYKELLQLTEKVLNRIIDIQ